MGFRALLPEPCYQRPWFPLGHRVLMLHEKKIYASAAPEEFFASPDPVVRQFVDGVADEKDNLFLAKPK